MYAYLVDFTPCPNRPILPNTDDRDDWEFQHVQWLINRWLEDEDRFDLGAIIGEFCEAKDGFLNSVLAKGVNQSNQIVVDALTNEVKRGRYYERHFYNETLLDVI